MPMMLISLASASWSDANSAPPKFFSVLGDPGIGRSPSLASCSSHGPELNNQRVGALVWETSRIDVLVEEGDE